MIRGFTDTQVIGTSGGFHRRVLSGVLRLAGYQPPRSTQRRARAQPRNTARAGRQSYVLSAKVDVVAIAVSRLEGAVYHGLPETRRTAE
jgi:hypothetical protein